MSDKVKVLLVEDEFITLDNLIDTVEDLGYEVSGTAMRAEEAIKVLEEGNTDLAVLDINLKGDKNGIWVAEQIQKKFPIPFIYLTAFADKDTVKKAAATQPSSYLVKPFTQPAVYAAIEVALSTYSSPFASEENALAADRYIFIKEDKAYKKLFLAEVRYVEAFKNYLEINLGESRHIIRSTLKDFAEQLPTEHFIQTHRSFIVNKNFVRSVAGEKLILTGRDIPITKTYRETLLERLEIV